MKIKDKRIYWVWLSLVCGAASRTAVKLARHFGSAKRIFEASARQLLESGAVKENDRIYQELLAHDIREAESIVNWCDEKGVRISIPGGEGYPKNFLSLRDAPMVLYSVGKLPEYDEECCVAVVGTRKMSAYGRAQAFRMGYGLASGGAIVVSGLALGIDGVAMASCIEAGGKTIGILGCGIDTVYPKEHKELFKAVIKNGAVITEYAPGTTPTRSSFPRRNRLISAMALGTVVVEADAFSGALITARHSIYQGKDVFSVPGNVESEGSEGTNQLIKEGAFTVTGASDVLERYEYIYPHGINLLKAKRSVLDIDTDGCAEAVCRKYDVRCASDRYSVYASSLKGSFKIPTQTTDGEKTHSEAATEIPKLYTSDKTEKRVNSFEASPEEPVRIDYDMLSDNEKRVYNAMSPDIPMIPDEIKVEGYKIQDIMAALTLLEISGAVEGGAGGYFMRCSSDDMIFDESSEGNVSHTEDPERKE